MINWRRWITKQKMMPWGVKKIVLAIFVSNILLSNFYIVFSQDAINSKTPTLTPTSISVDNINPQIQSNLEESSTYPSGEQFEKLKSLLEEYLVEINSWRGKYVWNIKYNDIIEREIKLIIKETYDNNKDFYNKKFLSKNFSYMAEEDKTLEAVIESIPKADTEYKISKILFNNNFVTDGLLNASFGVWYKSSNYDTFLYSLQRIIDNFERNYGYCPSIEELGKEKIYKDFKQVPISEVLDDINYKVEYKGRIFKEWEEELTISKLLEDVSFLEDDEKLEIEKDIETIKNGVANPQEMQIKYMRHSQSKENTVYIDMYAYIKDKYLVNSTYTLDYKDITYTYDQALEKNKEINTTKNDKGSDNETSKYKDYKKLIGDTPIKDIPEIYKKIPSDSMFFHIKNPDFMFQLLESKNTLVNSSSGIQILQKLKELSMDWFDIGNWDVVRNNLKHEFIVVMSDIDLSSPDIVVIINKEDKGVLVPRKKAKVAVSIWEYIYIANSKKALDKFTSLEENDSVYMADDFRYVWMKKQNLQKDIFFFVWDKFFENLISFDNYIKMTRKINDYMNLYDLQNYVWAYEKLTGWKVDSFDSINTILDIKKEKLDKYTINQSIVSDKNIGKYWDSINVNEANYDLSSISRAELKSYQENILKYKEIWRASLDPLGIIINSTEAWFEIDFFMTPIPMIDDNEFQLLVWLFSDLGLEDMDFLSNSKLRIGTLWWILGVDVDKLKKKLSTTETDKNSDAYYFKRDLAQFDKEVLWWEDFLDYLAGEFMLSFWWIDESILSAWDTEKLDIFFAIEFKNKLKAKEFVKKIRDLVAKDMSRGSSIENKLTSALIKPMLEEYNGQDIYIIPFKDFFFPITFYYTILDNYFYISISKVSIQKTIDYYVSNDNNSKTKFAKDNYLDGTKLLYGFFDADNIISYIDELLNSEMMEDLYIELKSNNNISKLNPILSQINKFYHNVEYSKLIGDKIRPLNEKIGILEFKSKGEILYLKINKEKLNITNKDILDALNSFFETINPEYFQWEWADISELLEKDSVFEDLVFLGIFNTFVDKDFVGNLFSNMSFSFDLGDNEIQLKINAFQTSEISDTWNSTTKSIKSENWNNEINTWESNEFILWWAKDGRKFMNDKRTYMAFWILALIVVVAIISTGLKGRKEVEKN